VPFNNKKKLQRQYNREWAQWFVFGAALGWPLATRLGRWAQTNPGGVPVTPHHRWMEDNFVVEAGYTTRKAFRRWAGLTMICTGYLMASYMSNPMIFNNRDYTRPDFKPKAAMIKDDSMLHDPTAVRQMQVAYTDVEFDPVNKRKSSLYRLFFPQDANYDVIENPYSGTDPNASYNPADGSFPTINNSFADHKA